MHRAEAPESNSATPPEPGEPGEPGEPAKENVHVRGVGYCVDRSCAEYLLLRVLRAGASEYACGACGKAGRPEFERGMRSSGPRISDVRVEFGFDPLSGIYRERVAVREPRLPRSIGTFTLQTPLVTRPEIAEALARALLERFAPLRHLAAGRRLLDPESFGAP